MSLVLPASVPVEGTRRVVFIEGGVPNLAAITVGAANGGDQLSCYITGQGVNLSEDTAVIKDGRLCSSQDLEAEGRDTVTVELTYVFNLNEPTDDEARLALPRGVSGTLVLFYQKDEEEATFSIGDWYRAIDVTAGKQRPMAPEENAVDRIMQKMFTRSTITDFRQLVAGS